MRIAVHTSGGLFPVRRRVEIDDHVVRVTDTPPDDPPGTAVCRETPLRPADAHRLRALASKVVAAGDQIDEEPGGIDGGTTLLRVDDGQANSRVEIRRGRTTGREVWDLLDAVDRVSANS